MMVGATIGDGDNLPEDQGDPLGWKHIARLHTCQHCDRIVVTHFQLEHGLIPLPHTKAEALRAEADGCPIFRMLNGSWQLIKRHHGPGDLLKFFRILSDPKCFKDRQYTVDSASWLSRLSNQNRARLDKTAIFLQKTKFILDNLRRRHLHLVLGFARVKFLHGATAIECESELKVLDGTSMESP